MEWKSTKYDKPLAYKTGHWDGKMSDKVLVKNRNGEMYLATYYEGFIDGCAFEDWYDSNEFFINDVVEFLVIPES